MFFTFRYTSCQNRWSLGQNLCKIVFVMQLYVTVLVFESPKNQNMVAVTSGQNCCRFFSENY